MLCNHHSINFNQFALLKSGIEGIIWMSKHSCLQIHRAEYWSFAAHMCIRTCDQSHIVTLAAKSRTHEERYRMLKVLLSI